MTFLHLFNLSLFNKTSPRLFWALCAFDLFMSGAALTIDYKDFFELPPYLWPFAPICPLYPLLLAILFLFYLRRGKFPAGLAHFTAVGIVSYALMALVFYPSYLFENGFGWYEIGNILWVFLYGAQILLLLPLPRISPFVYVPIGAYFFTKDITDRFFGTFSYERYDMLSENLATGLFIVIIAIHAGVIAAFLIHQKRRLKFAAAFSGIDT